MSDRTHRPELADRLPSAEILPTDSPSPEGPGYEDEELETIRVVSGDRHAFRRSLRFHWRGPGCVLRALVTDGEGNLKVPAVGRAGRCDLLLRDHRYPEMTWAWSSSTKMAPSKTRSIALPNRSSGPPQIMVLLSNRSELTRCSGWIWWQVRVGPLSSRGDASPSDLRSPGRYENAAMVFGGFRTFVGGARAKGSHTVTFDAGKLPQRGTLFVRARTVDDGGGEEVWRHEAELPLASRRELLSPSSADWEFSVRGPSGQVIAGHGLELEEPGRPWIPELPPRRVRTGPSGRVSVAAMNWPSASTSNEISVLPDPRHGRKNNQYQETVERLWFSKPAPRGDQVSPGQKRLRIP